MRECDSCFEKYRVNNHPDKVKPEYDPEHEQAHSKVIDVCVDKGILPLVEWIASLGIKTMHSCQGNPENEWGEFPYIQVEGEILEIHEKIKSASAYLDSITQYSVMYAIGNLTFYKGPKFRTKLLYYWIPDMEKVIGKA